MNRKNREWQEKMYERQYSDQKEYAKYLQSLNREDYELYESPSAKRAGMAAAGINPFVEGSVITPSASSVGSNSGGSVSPAPSDGPYKNNPFSNIQPGASSIMAAASQQVQLENVRAQTELTNATRLKTLAETKSIENANSLFDFVRSAAESDALSKRFKAKIDQVNAEFAEIKAIQDSAERDARIAELWSREENNLAQAAKTDADRLTVETLRDGMKRLQDAQIENTEAQTETEGAKQDNLRSDSKYKRMLTHVEDAILEPFLQEMHARIRNLDQSTLTEEQRTDLVRTESELKEILTNHERGPMREFLRKIETTGRSLWRFLLPPIGG